MVSLLRKSCPYHKDDIGGSGCVGVFDELGNHRSERGCKVKVVNDHSVECILPSKVEVVQGSTAVPFVGRSSSLRNLYGVMVLHEGRKEVESLGNRSKSVASSLSGSWLGFTLMREVYLSGVDE